MHSAISYILPFQADAEASLQVMTIRTCANSSLNELSMGKPCWQIIVLNDPGPYNVPVYKGALFHSNHL
jgi:hypothetical protein